MLGPGHSCSRPSFMSLPFVYLLSAINNRQTHHHGMTWLCGLSWVLYMKEQLTEHTDHAAMSANGSWDWPNSACASLSMHLHTKDVQADGPCASTKRQGLLQQVSSSRPSDVDASCENQAGSKVSFALYEIKAIGYLISYTVVHPQSCCSATRIDQW